MLPPPLTMVGGWLMGGRRVAQWGAIERMVGWCRVDVMAAWLLWAPIGRATPLAGKTVMPAVELTAQELFETINCAGAALDTSMGCSLPPLWVLLP